MVKRDRDHVGKAAGGGVVDGFLKESRRKFVDLIGWEGLVLELDIVFGDDMLPGLVGDEVVCSEADASVFGEVHHAADGSEVFEEEFVVLVEELGSIGGLSFVGLRVAVLFLVSRKAELVDGADGGFEDSRIGHATFHFGDVFGVIHDASDDGRREVVVNRDALLDKGEGFARARDGIHDEMTGGGFDEINAGLLFRGEVGREDGERRGREGEGDVHKRKGLVYTESQHLGC